MLFDKIVYQILLTIQVNLLKKKACLCKVLLSDFHVYI